MKPLLKWAGGKQRLLDELIPRLPADYSVRRHVEPFVGGGALFFAQEPARSRLNDTNGALITIYYAVRDEPEKTLGILERLAAEYETKTDLGRAEFYYELRRRFNAGFDSWQDEPEEAALALFLNKLCFNGLWRVNKKGAFNVPFGRYKKPRIYDAERLLAASRVLRDAHVFEDDFAEIPYGTDNFIYFDPPYVPISKTSNFTAYTTAAFGAAEQKRLADLFDELTERRIPCMLSNADAPAVRALYKNPAYRIEQVTVRRSISAKKSSREEVGELIVRNY